MKLVGEFKLENDPNMELRVTRVDGCGDPGCAFCGGENPTRLWVLWLGRGARWVFLDALAAEEFDWMERVKVATTDELLPTLRRLTLILGAPWSMVEKHQSVLAGRQHRALCSMDDAFLELLAHPDFPEQHLESVIDGMDWANEHR